MYASFCNEYIRIYVYFWLLGMCMYVCMCISVEVYTYTSIHIRVYPYPSWIHIRLYIYVYTHLPRVYIYVYTGLYIYVYTHIPRVCIYVYTYTCILVSLVYTYTSMCIRRVCTCIWDVYPFGKDMSIHVYVHPFVVYTYMYTPSKGMRIHIRTHVPVHPTYVHTYIYISHTRIHVICTYIPLKGMCTCIRVYMYAHTYPRTEEMWIYTSLPKGCTYI